MRKIILTIITFLSITFTISAQNVTLTFFRADTMFNQETSTGVYMHWGANEDLTGNNLDVHVQLVDFQTNEIVSTSIFPCLKTYKGYIEGEDVTVYEVYDTAPETNERDYFSMIFWNNGNVVMYEYTYGEVVITGDLRGIK